MPQRQEVLSLSFFNVFLCMSVLHLCVRVGVSVSPLWATSASLCKLSEDPWRECLVGWTDLLDYGRSLLVECSNQVTQIAK